MTKPDVDNFSRAFYPFLHEERTSDGKLLEDLGFSLLEKARESAETVVADLEADVRDAQVSIQE